MRLLFTTAAAVVLALGTFGAAQARPLVVHSSPFACDGGGPSGPRHELGWGPSRTPADIPPIPGVFPADEDIASSFTVTEASACGLEAGGVDTPMPNFLVSITNHTGKSWQRLWFVSDVTGVPGNTDAVVGEFAPPPPCPPEIPLCAPPFAIPGGFGFLIDDVGANRPLVGGDDGDLIFEPLETWHFIVQDWPFPEVSFGSLGIGAASGAPDPMSNASIIAFEVPEPATLAILGLGLAGLGLARRKRRG